MVDTYIKTKTVRETAQVTPKRMSACLFLITKTKKEKTSKAGKAWRQELIY